MAVEDYNDNNNNLHHLRRDVHEAHTSSQVAKVLSIMALIGTIIALGISIYALDKAGEAASTANRAIEISERVDREQ